MWRFTCRRTEHFPCAAGRDGDDHDTDRALHADASAVTKWVWRFILAVLVFLPDWSFAGTAVYKCTKNGQTILTDKPCEDPSAASVASATSGQSQDSPRTTTVQAAPIGKWRGQAQYQVSENGQHVGNAQSVVVLELVFDPEGKVSGASMENGCRVLGLWSQGGTPRIFALDLSFSACGYPDYNRRYSGTLLIGAPNMTAQLFLQAYTTPMLEARVRRFDVSGTMHR